MRNKDELKQIIEETRKKLDACIESGDFQQTYDISKKLDLLIEEYIESNTDHN